MNKEVKMNKLTKEKIKTMNDNLPVRKDALKLFTPECYEHLDPKPVFKFKRWNNKQVANYRDALKNHVLENGSDIVSVHIKALEPVFEGWENLFYDDGDEFEYESIKDVELLPHYVVDSIIVELGYISGLVARPNKDESKE